MAASCESVLCRPSCWATGSSTCAVVASALNEGIKFWVYAAPCERSLTDEAPDTEKNSDVLAPILRGVRGREGGGQTEAKQPD